MGASRDQARPMREWAQRSTRVGVVALPLLLVLRSQIELAAPLLPLAQFAGAITLLLAPGYLLLWSLGQEPSFTREGAPSYRWPLVVPLSLALDAILGTALVLTPIGLTARSLWTGLSIGALILVAVVAARRRNGPGARSRPAKHE